MFLHINKRLSFIATSNFRDLKKIIAKNSKIWTCCNEVTLNLFDLTICYLSVIKAKASVAIKNAC